MTQLLTENRDKLDSLTERLLEQETLDMDDAYAAAGLVAPRVPADVARPRSSARLTERGAAALDAGLTPREPLARPRRAAARPAPR